MKKTLLGISFLLISAIGFASSPTTLNTGIDKELLGELIFECTTFSRWECNGEVYEVEVTADDCGTASEVMVDVYEEICE